MLRCLKKYEQSPDAGYYLCVSNIHSLTLGLLSGNFGQGPKYDRRIIWARVTSVVEPLIQKWKVPLVEPSVPSTFQGLTLIQWKLVRNELHLLNTSGKQTREYRVTELLDLHCTAVVLEVSKTKRQQFNLWVDSQFKPGASASKLFKYIDNETHEMLIVDVSRFSQAGMSHPTQILDQVADKYVEFCSPLHNMQNHKYMWPLL